MKKELVVQIILFALTMTLTPFSYALARNDPLPSWNDSQTKQNIIQFVNSVTNKSSPDYVVPAERIATIDNDGTLWVEQPMYTQVLYMLSRFKQLAPKHPEWQQNPDLKPALSGDFKNLSEKGMRTIMTLTSSNLTVEDYEANAKQWLKDAVNPHFKKHYTQLIYQPMLEVINYLQANGFKTYIVTGAGQEFVRAFAANTYHIPSENIIGSTTKIEYTFVNSIPTMTLQAQPLLVSNFAGKPEAIQLFIGKKPIIAFGNSDGDKQMLEWTQSNKHKHLMLLVHHDDADREFAYDEKSKVGTFSASLFTEANNSHWDIISMKNDWKVIFPYQAH